jgi:hypothetical protein
MKISASDLRQSGAEKPNSRREAARSLPQRERPAELR